MYVVVPEVDYTELVAMQQRGTHKTCDRQFGADEVMNFHIGCVTHCSYTAFFFLLLTEYMSVSNAVGDTDIEEYNVNNKA